MQYVLVENGNKIITETEQQTDNLVLNVYPNPTSNNLKIDVPTTGFSKIEIVDTKGTVQYEELLNQDATSHEIKISLQAEMYLVKLIKKEKILQKKIIIK